MTAESKTTEQISRTEYVAMLLMSLEERGYSLVDSGIRRRRHTIGCEQRKVIHYRYVEYTPCGLRNLIAYQGFRVGLEGC